ncbi:MAG: transporter substrate-binding domain-containing protein [Motiliproteus sp.]
MRREPGLPERLIRRFHRFLLLTLLFSLPPLVGAETLRFAADPSCPYVCPDAKEPDQLAADPGIIYEILKLILEPEGYELAIEFIPYRRSLKSTKLGEYDALMVTLRDDAPSLYYHQTPIAMARGCFVTQRSNPWQYRGVESLKQVRFGGTLGYKYGPLKEFIETKNTSTLMMAGEDTFDRILHMIELDRLDTTIEDINVIHYKLQQLGMDKKLRLAGCLPPKVPLYVGISPSYSDRNKLSALIDEGIRRLTEQGELDTIAKKYGIK